MHPLPFEDVSLLAILHEKVPLHYVFESFVILVDAAIPLEVPAVLDPLICLLLHLHLLLLIPQRWHVVVGMPINLEKMGWFHFGRTRTVNRL